jgi:hypothetical protein
MPQFSVQTQIDVIMAAFALHNYIRMNSHDDLLFTMVELSITKIMMVTKNFRMFMMVTQAMKFQWIDQQR